MLVPGILECHLFFPCSWHVVNVPEHPLAMLVERASSEEGAQFCFRSLGLVCSDGGVGSCVWKQGWKEKLRLARCMGRTIGHAKYVQNALTQKPLIAR